MTLKKIGGAVGTALALGCASPVFAVEFSLFGDIDAVDGNRDAEVSTFRLGKLDLFVNQDIDDASRVSVEIIFQDTGAGVETEVERFAATYRVDDALNVGAGRFHTPLGFWNHNFHHGIIVQDTVSRPFFLESEDAHEGVFPTHIVGIVANGTTEREALTVNYHLAVANGPSMNTSVNRDDGEVELDVNNYNDGTNDKTLLARFGFAPVDGNWAIGLSAMSNHVSESGDPAADPTESPYLPKGEVLFDQQVVGVDARYTMDQYYLIAEYFQIRMKDNAGFNTQRPGVAANPDQYSGTAQYAQFGYTVTDKVGVAVRVEELKVDPGATYFELRGMGDQKRTVYALRYNLSDSNVLRFQLSKVSNGDESYSQYVAQWFFMLF